MRYTIAKEQEVKNLAKEGRSLEYISSVTEIPKKVIWQWCPELRPHEDIIKQSVKQRYHSIYPDYEAKISAAFSPFVRTNISEEDWDKINRVIYDTLFEESIYVFKNVISDPPNFGDIKKLSNEKFVDYMKKFWDFDSSPYISERNSEKQCISRGYADICRNTIHFWSFLKNKLMRDVTKGDIEILHERLVSKGYSPCRIYSILKVGLTPLEYAYNNGLTLLKTYDYKLPKKTKKSSNIEPQLVSKIFNSDWKDQEAYIAALTCYYSGLPIRSICKLRIGDVYTDGTIITDDKVVKIPSKIVDAIFKYASTSPYKDFKPEDFVFFTIDRNRHSSGYRWNDELKEVASAYTDKIITFSALN